MATVVHSHISYMLSALCIHIFNYAPIERFSNYVYLAFFMCLLTPNFKVFYLILFLVVNFVQLSGQACPEGNGANAQGPRNP